MKLSKIKKFLLFSFVGAFLILMLSFDDAFFDGTKNGIKLVLETVIPSTFPFMILSTFALESNAFCFIERIFKNITKKIFRLPPVCSSVILFSFIGGYPMGALLANRASQKGSINKNNLNLLLCFAFMGSPSFIIGGVGRQLLRNQSLGIMLYISLLASSLITGLLFSRFFSKDDIEDSSAIMEKQPSQSLIDSFVKSTKSACDSMAIICGYVVLFSGIIGFLKSVCGENYLFAVISSVLEVTSGVFYTAKFFGLPAVAFSLTFGGFAIHFQIFSILKGKIKPSLFLFARFFSSALSFIICKILLRFFSPALSVYSSFESARGEITRVSPVLSLSLVLLSFFMIISSGRKKGAVDFTADL